MSLTKRNLTHFEIDHAARAAHEVNRAYAMSLGDFTHAPWDTAPEEQKRSCRQGVVDVATNELNPEQAHEAWRTAKLADGWSYGTVKDREKKTHPCMVSYAELPEEQRYKDVLFTTVVKAMLDGFWRRPQ